MIKVLIAKIYRLYRRKQIRKGYKSLYKKICKSPNKIDNEKEWLKKWIVLDSNVSINAYRTFAKYTNNDINTISLESAAIYIDTCLNNVKYMNYLEDKNLYDRMFPSSYLPKTILRNMDGFYYDKDYLFINKISDKEFKFLLTDLSAVIVKPAVESGSGKNVMLFRRYDDVFIDKNNNLLSIEFLNKFFKKNYIIQECLEQVGELSFLNRSSCNTIRCMMYKSVKSDDIIFCNAILRIGKANSDVDNAHAGGRYCSIDKKGKLGKYTCDYLGNKQEEFNGIDFVNSNIQLPNYDKVKSFAVNVVERIPYMRLIALDILIDKNGEPKLIEYNLSSFSYWLFTFTGQSTYGDYTDEVIEYCKNNHSDVFYKSITF